VSIFEIFLEQEGMKNPPRRRLSLGLRRISLAGRYLIGALKRRTT